MPTSLSPFLIAMTFEWARPRDQSRKGEEKKTERTAYQLRKVDVDEFIVLDIDALESGDVISRRRRPVNNFQYPVVAVGRRVVAAAAHK